MMQMIYQVKENTEDIRKLKEENIKVKSELEETRDAVKILESRFNAMAKQNEYLQAQLNHQQSQTFSF